MSAEQVPSHPPGAWRGARELLRTLGGPLDRFLRVEAAGGIVLAAAAVLALVWANSPAASAYEELWSSTLGVHFRGFAFDRPLHFWVNDGLMTLFFFMVGLEIRWEIYGGALSTLRGAALPAFAAAGGMIAPAVIYLACARPGGVARGWGVPIATDIAFALGALTFLGRRVPPVVRVFLLALAILDDIGAIVVIGVFYAARFSWAGLVVAAGGAVLVYLLRKLGARRFSLYAIPALLVWGGLLHAGIHPTLAGVVLGWLTPVRAWYGAPGFAATSRDLADAVESAADERELLSLLERARTARREALPPAIAWRARLHPVVSFVIMPLFALVNAGVALDGVSLRDARAWTVFAGVFAGLVVGKPLGVLLGSVIAIKAGLASLPSGMAWRDLVLVGLVAGVGFTMAIFIADLAFADDAILGTAKLAVLVASAVAASLGLSLGFAGKPPPASA
jgi:NhaA family Na+:H+ antiporter